MFPPFRQRYSQSPHLLTSPFLSMHCHIQMSQEPLCQSTLACRGHVGWRCPAAVSPCGQRVPASPTCSWAPLNPTLTFRAEDPEASGQSSTLAHYRARSNSLAVQTGPASGPSPQFKEFSVNFAILYRRFLSFNLVLRSRAHGADVFVVPVPNRPTGPLVLNAVLMALRSALRSQRN
ncbi:uncharacterized [Tachysurus ichikawai]